MKGVIKKTKQGLIVKYFNPTFTNQSLPVHPIDVNLLKDGDEVEFIVVEEWSEYLSLLIKYGKIVNHYNETYGSNGSDKEKQKKLITEIMNEDAKNGLYNTSTQTEISDEEIFYQKQVINPYPTGEQSYTAYEKGFMDCAKWYREQLKKK